MTGARTSAARVRSALVYVAIAAATVAAYLALRSYGENLSAPTAPPEPPMPGVSVPGETFAHILLALAVITLAARFLGRAFQRYLRQPPVFGEILAGILLGPSFLGAISPEAYALLMPPAVTSYLVVIAQIGVVLYMFLVGLHMDLRLLGEQTTATFSISLASIVAPFLLGSALATGLYTSYSTSSVSFTVFSLFFGVSLSVTAFPVLARILTDRMAQGTRLGVMALACAAVNDITAWTLLAFLTAVASAQLSGMTWKVGALFAYIILMLVLVRPLLSRFSVRQNAMTRPASQTALAIVFAGVLLSALATELIGVHALFGAFLMGTLLPHAGRMAEGIRSRLEDVVIVLFLPSFFALTGMRTQLGLLATAQDWLVCGLIVLVATVGKFGGTFVAARLNGMPTRNSAALGVLMNTRGLMELIVLNVGLVLRVITPTVFTMMVIMALVTTFSATPLLDLILGRHGFADVPVDGIPAGDTAPQSAADPDPAPGAASPHG